MKKDCIQSFWFFFEKRTAGQKSNGYFTFGKICNEVYRPNEERSFFMAFSTSKKDTSIRSSPHASGKSRMERPLLRTASRMAFITFCRVGSSLKKRQCLTAIVRVNRQYDCTDGFCCFYLHYMSDSRIFISRCAYSERLLSSLSHLAPLVRSFYIGCAPVPLST